MNNYNLQQQACIAEHASKMGVSYSFAEAFAISIGYSELIKALSF